MLLRRSRPRRSKSDNQIMEASLHFEVSMIAVGTPDASGQIVRDVLSTVPTAQFRADGGAGCTINPPSGTPQWIGCFNFLK